MKGKIIPILLITTLATAGIVFWLEKNNPGFLAELEAQKRFKKEVIGLLEMPETGAAFYEAGNVVRVSRGAVSLQKANGTRIEITTASLVAAGDRLTVSRDGEAEIQWFEGSVSRLAAGTEIEIKKADYDRENISKTQIAFFATRGKIWNKVMRLIDGDSEFLIESTESIAGVRGSVFNYVLEEGKKPTVACLDHAILLTDKSRPESMTIIVGGEEATLTQGAIEVEKIPDLKLKEVWYADNKAKDEIQTENIKQKNFERIKAIAGILPGEMDYEKKKEALEDYLGSLENPEEQKRVRAQMDRLAFYENLAVLDSSALKVSITAWKENATDKERMKNELKGIERRLGEVLADEKDLYELKEIIREEHIRLESDPDKQKRAMEKGVERKLYELNDLSEKEGVDPKIIEEQLKEYEKGLNKIEKGLEEQNAFKTIHTKMLQKIPATPEQMKKINEMKKYFDKKESNEFPGGGGLLIPTPSSDPSSGATPGETSGDDSPGKSENAPGQQKKE